MKRGAVLGLGTLLAAALSPGCSTATTELELQPRAVVAVTATASAKPAEVLAAPIPVFITPVADQRLDPESLGNAGNRPFVAKAVPQWVEVALRANIEKQLPLAATAEQADLVVRPSLHKCYVASVDITKAAVIVIDVAFVHRGKDAGHRIYRGQHARMNWWNSDAELAGALQAAFDDCVARIVADAEARAKLIAGQKKT